MSRSSSSQHDSRPYMSLQEQVPHVSLVLAMLAFLLPACTSLLKDSDTEERANAHMRLADSLEQESAWREAAFEYNLVVQHWPRSTSYKEALRKAALLSLHPGNTARSDSAAVAMIGLYLEEGPGSEKERESMEALLTVIDRLNLTRKEMQRKEQQVSSLADSLAQVIQKQSSSASGQSQRVAELEQQLRQATEELQKLKQVDVEISRSRRQKGGRLRPGG